MAIYKYKGINTKGEKIEGTKSADNPQKLAQICASEGIILSTFFEQVVNTKINYKMKISEVSDFARSLSAMLTSGVTINRAIGIMEQSIVKPSLKQVYEELNVRIEAGNSISDAMKSLGSVFPKLMINMITAGEQKGKLSETTQRLAIHYEKEHKMKGKLQAATTYPIMLLIITLLVIFILFVFVMPKFVKIFDQMTDAELPLITRIILGISNFMTNNIVLVLILTAGFIIGMAYLFTRPTVKLSLHRSILRIPIVGRLVKIVNTAMFARTFSSLYMSGISVYNSVIACSSVIGNTYIQSQLKSASHRIKDGEMLSTVLKDVEGFDVKLATTTEVGEESGKLGEMMTSIADFFDYESEQATQKILTIIEPAAIVFMAIIVGTIILAVMLPIFLMYNTIG